MSFIREREVILFQGDSVTDCGRDYNNLYDLGGGYPLHVSAALAAHYPDRDYVFINKGISGNRACDLLGRWDRDCIALKPTLVSILIGINDTWRRYDSNDPTSVEVFEERYRTLLARTQEETGARLLLLEPFVLPVKPGQETWREDLDPKIHAIRKLASEYGARYVPLDGLFAAAAAIRSADHWAADGVHPSFAGHGLIAKAWLDTVSD